MNRFLTFCQKTIAVIGIMIFGVLSYYSLRYTMIRYYSGEAWDHYDIILLHIMELILAVIILGIVVKICNKLSEKSMHVIAIIISGIVIFVCRILYLSADFQPIVDQVHIYINAASIADPEIGYIVEPQYFTLFPFQIGLTEMMAFLLKTVGFSSPRVIQSAHCILMGLTVYIGYRITREIFKNIKIELLYLILAMLFLPEYIYTMYVYGETLGICAAMYGCFFFLLANRNETTVKRAVLYYVAMIFCMTIAYLARGAMLVVCVAFLIIQIMLCLKSKKFLYILPILLTFPCVILAAKGMTALAENQSNYEYGEGCPKIMWIAMGMQESDAGAYYPGTYNGFNADVFIENDYNVQATAEIGKKAIIDRLQEWSKHPADMIDFYRRKTIFQWNNPTYDAFFATYYMENPKDWLYKAYFDETVHNGIINFMDGYQFLVYIALLVYYIKELVTKSDVKNLFLGLIMVGGFLFSLLWETNSRYVFPYIAITLPCAAAGFFYMENWVAMQGEKCKQLILNRKK